MDFQKKIETHVSEMKDWMHNHLNFTHKHHHNHCDMFMNLEHFSPRMEWLRITKILPGELVADIHKLTLVEHEKFLSAHFKVAKKMRELKHKKDILKLDIAEHCHLKESDFDKKIVSESLDALKKINKESRDLLIKESQRFFDAKEKTEDAVHDKIQEFLKK